MASIESLSSNSQVSIDEDDLSLEGDRSPPDRATLLTSALEWPSSRLEEELYSLLKDGKKVLCRGGCGETQMMVFRLVTQKLLPLVPIFELEDLVVAPVLQALLISLQEVLAELASTEEKNRHVFLSIAEMLLENCSGLLKHVETEMAEGCGLGEVPSIAGKLPKILLVSFQGVASCNSLATNPQLKGAFKHFFDFSKELFDLFLQFMARIKIRSVLEDELCILIDLCQDLIDLHKALLPLEFKAVFGVWKLYNGFISSHKSKLLEKLNFGFAIEILSEDCVNILDKFNSMLEDEATLARDLSKCLFKANHLLKVIQAIGDEVGSAMVSQEAPNFLRLLVSLIQAPSLPDKWGKEPLPSKVKEVYSSHVFFKLLDNAISSDGFISYLFNFFESGHLVEEILTKNSWSSIQCILQILLLLRPAPGKPNFNIGSSSKSLVDLVFSLVSCSPEFLFSSKLQGRTPLGQAPSNVHPYTWTLSNFCAWISSALPEEFSLVESSLISGILDPDTSVISFIFISDVWCFISRYGSSELCLSHLQLLAEIMESLEDMEHSPAKVFIPILMSRLFNLLGDKERTIFYSTISEFKEPLLPCYYVLSPPEEIHPRIVSQLSHVNDFVSMDLLSAAVSLSSSVDSNSSLNPNVSKSVLQIWQKLGQNAYEIPRSLEASSFIVTLTKTLLSTPDKPSENLMEILRCLSSMLECGGRQPLLQLTASNILRVAARDWTRNGDTQVARLIKECFQTLTASPPEPYCLYLLNSIVDDLKLTCPEIDLHFDYESLKVSSINFTRQPKEESEIPEMGKVIKDLDDGDIDASAKIPHRKRKFSGDQFDDTVNKMVNDASCLLETVSRGDAKLLPGRKRKISSVINILQNLLDSS